MRVVGPIILFLSSQCELVVFDFFCIIHRLNIVVHYYDVADLRSLVISLISEITQTNRKSVWHSTSTVEKVTLEGTLYADTNL